MYTCPLGKHTLVLSWPYILIGKIIKNKALLYWFPNNFYIAVQTPPPPIIKMYFNRRLYRIYMDYGICNTCKTIWDFQTIKFLFYWLSIFKKISKSFLQETSLSASAIAYVWKCWTVRNKMTGGFQSLCKTSKGSRAILWWWPVEHESCCI